jgi:hypothetical protein
MEPLTYASDPPCLHLLFVLTSPGLSTAAPSLKTRTVSDARSDMDTSFSPHDPTAEILHSLQSDGLGGRGGGAGDINEH